LIEHPVDPTPPLMASDRFEIERRPYEDADVQRMVEQVQDEYVQMYGGPDAAAVDPAEFAPPNGVMLVGGLGGVVVAMGGWRRLAGGVARAELKRMYVLPGARGRGLSRRMLVAIEQDALAAGIREMVLNTGPEQHAAIRLYLGSGYSVAAAFGHYAKTGDALFYAKTLDPSPAR
jgi:ribosomal protein S18 acetylase RimI-like enzyme